MTVEFSHCLLSLSIVLYLHALSCCKHAILPRFWQASWRSIEHSRQAFRGKIFFRGMPRDHRQHRAVLRVLRLRLILTSSI